MPITPASFSSYLEDASGYRGEATEVLLPENVAELREIVRQSTAGNLPLTVAGAGTGLTGARVPQGGRVISLERFRLIEVEKGLARCGAGAILKDLHEAAARIHQFFGPNPTESSASIGGIFSTNAGGARSFRYGAVRGHAVAVEVTFADGQTRRFDRNEKVDFPFVPVRVPATTKNSAGYFLQPDMAWIDLLAGSEGTLGIVTEIHLKLLPEPQAILSGVIFFPTDEHALNAADSWRSVPELRLLEYMDEYALGWLRPTYAEIPSGAGAALLIEQNLSSEEDPEVELWADRLAEHEAFEETSWFGFRQTDQARFRDFRHALPTMVTDTVRKNGFSKFGTDFAVPLASYRQLHSYYKRRCQEVLPGQFTIFGHIGDANNHVNLLPRSVDEAKRGEELIDEFAATAVSMGGTVAAEHGIGKTKTDLLALMYSPAEIATMKNVKRHLDPKWLLGQGTIFQH